MCTPSFLHHIDLNTVLFDIMLTKYPKKWRRSEVPNYVPPSYHVTFFHTQNFRLFSLGRNNDECLTSWDASGVLGDPD